ncbi:CaiB/BaiF CoA transferase family protein [Spiribacter pallidus]|uniref:CaiB/BaiF CoA transferase family protein n=1 Tax=Spiribacter pallidus TaxID=1987936 RepID=UPI0034A0AB26
MGPLEGIRVLELGQLIAGPFCGQYLADFGAEVVKVEPPGRGDPMRQWGSTDAHGNTVWWPVIARNKRSMTLDLRTEAGQAVIRELAAQVDVIIENFRPGTMERWGLGYEALSEINPRLVMVRITGFGQTGPYATRAGYASVCEAMGGMRYIAGYPDRPPVRMGISIGDTLAGMHGAMGAMMALHERHRSGRGQVVDSAIYESVMTVMESLIPEYEKTGRIRERSGSRLDGIAPSNAYPCRDGREVVIGANQDTVFRRLCEAMGAPELADDPRYVDHQSRGRNQDALDARIADWTRAHDADEIVERMAEAGVPAGHVYRAPEMLADPHMQARESIVRMQDARLGEIPMQNAFPRLSRSPGCIEHTGPALGEHTREVLQDWAAMTPEHIERLAEQGVI